MKDDLINIAIALAVVGLVAATAVAVVRATKSDSTDPASGSSGLLLYTDYGTGCQYVSSYSTGITPRLGPDGKPLCDPALVRK